MDPVIIFPPCFLVLSALSAHAAETGLAIFIVFALYAIISDIMGRRWPT